MFDGAATGKPEVLELSGIGPLPHRPSGGITRGRR
jgi:hypothetical protein